MSDLVPTPRLEAEAFLLRPPVRIRGRREGPAIYTETDLRRAEAAAERRGAEQAAAGFEEIRARLEAESRAAVRRFQEAGVELAASRRGILNEAAAAAVDLAFRVARRIVRRDAAADPGAVVPLLRELLQRSAAASAVIVRLSPRDHAFLLAHAGEVPEAGGMDGLRFRADASVSDGGCVVETEAGRLDGTIETQFDRIEEALAPPRPSAPAPAPPAGKGADRDGGTLEPGREAA